MNFPQQAKQRITAADQLQLLLIRATVADQATAADQNQKYQIGSTIYSKILVTDKLKFFGITNFLALS